MLPPVSLLALTLLAASPSSARCEIDFKEAFDVAPATLFPYLSDADKIRWLGPFKVVQLGEVDQYGKGSVRQVRFVGLIVEEQIMHYDPPHELRYAVTQSKSIRNHVASMRVLETTAGTSRLSWSIEFESTKRNPQRHCRWTRRYLQRRIKRLRRALSK